VDSTVGRALQKRVSDEEARRFRTILAAADAIDEIGPQVGLAEIADRAGLQRPNVYRLFKSKDVLDAEVAGFAATELIRRVRPALSRPGTVDEIVYGIIDAALSWAEEHANLYRFLAARQQTKALHRARMGRTRLLGEVVDALGAYMRAQTPPVEPTEPADGLMVGLMGMVDASIVWWLDHRDESREDVIRRLTRQVVVVLTDAFSGLGLEITPELVLDPPR
jgi:AcrR family transcriptional regulator